MQKFRTFLKSRGFRKVLAWTLIVVYMVHVAWGFAWVGMHIGPILASLTTLYVPLQMILGGLVIGLPIVLLFVLMLVGSYLILRMLDVDIN